MPVIAGPLNAQGHAHVQVALSQTVARQQALQRAGQPVPQRVLTAGMLDTGASITIIDPLIRQQLNLVPFRVGGIRVPAQPIPIRASYFKLDLTILHPSGVAADNLVVPLLNVLETPLAHTGVEVLIGCDVLSRCTFIHRGQAQSFHLTY